MFQKEMQFCFGMVWVVIRFGEERSDGFPGLMEGHDDLDKGKRHCIDEAC